MIPFIGLMLLSLALGTVATLFLDEKYSHIVSSAFSGIAMLLSFAILIIAFTSGLSQFSESYIYYISQFNINFNLQLTPISFTLLLMASIVCFVTCVSGNVEHEDEKTANSLVLLFEFAAIGLFASANLLVFFIFWDIGVIALFFMIYLLGSANRRRAAIKFLMYEILASMLLLFGIMLIYFYTPLHSFDINYISQNAALIPANVQIMIFLLLFIAFLINMPVFPVHLWLPDAHTEASTQGSMLLSGVLTKFGGYGMLLTFLMIPISFSYSTTIALLGGFSAFYLSFVLLTQHDIKRIIAYTTIVEMSIILIGIAASNLFSIPGATYAMLAHGLTISMLFLAAGSIGHMFGERDIRSLKGIIKSSASTCYTFLMGVFATTGIPLTAAFIGDVLIFIGAIKEFSILAAIPLLSLIIIGAFLYYIVNKSMLSTKDASKNVEFIGKSQNLGYAILLFFIFFFGVLPFIILKLFSL
ncbi:MAG: NuoM family protein [Candidatus Micrarchaeales archaeon]